MIPRRMWLEIDPLYPSENCSAYPELTSCDEDGEAENEVPRQLYISEPALRWLVREWRTRANLAFIPPVTVAWREAAAMLEGMLEGMLHDDE